MRRRFPDRTRCCGRDRWSDGSSKQEPAQPRPIRRGQQRRVRDVPHERRSGRGNDGSLPCWRGPSGGQNPAQCWGFACVAKRNEQGAKGCQSRDTSSHPTKNERRARHRSRSSLCRSANQTGRHCSSCGGDRPLLPLIPLHVYICLFYPRSGIWAKAAQLLHMRK